MTQTAVNYGIVLYELGVPEEAVKESRRIWMEVPLTGKALTDPVIPEIKKYRIIEQVFPKEMVNFLKVVCKNKQAGKLEEIFEAYEDWAFEKRDILKASLTYVTPPTEEQARKMEELLKSRYKKREVRLVMRQDPGLIGGFILKAAGRETDRSLRGRLERLRRLAAET